ncbi:small oligopeptide transporter [Mycena olivaceomarginata]|nr:small oligopeptide transporter [Mycena olivaceomarginata]
MKRTNWLKQVPTLSKALAAAHFDDPNLDERLITGLEDESPYSEVRSAVANTDDPDMAVNTFRAWVLGLVCAIIVSLSFRFPSVAVGGVVVLILTFPVGCTWASYVPNWCIAGLTLNPGPFTIKEHVLIVIMVVAAQRVFYGQDYNFSFSVPRIVHQTLKTPALPVWPSNLVTCVILNTFHSRTYTSAETRGGMSRGRFFVYAFLGSFAWHFFPGYIFQALSYFSWVTWIRPNDPVVAQLFGYVHGTGMSIITFDWSQIAFAGSPLVTPWWAQVNIFGGILKGFLVFFWFLVPVLYFTNTWYGKFMPISSIASYDNQMHFYNVSAILTPESTLDLDAYRNYSPLFISSTFAMAYGKYIWVQMRSTIHQQPDIHARLMSKYPQVPQWWYAVICLSMMVFGIISIEVWPTGTPVWALVVALVLALAYVVPVGIIQAITGQQVGLNVMTELIVGYALPGHPIAMMLFKTWGFNTMGQALSFAADFKLGHYMKIPPRTMFWGQVIGTIVAGTVQLGVQAWMFGHIEFICPAVEIFGTSSIIVRVIGPELMFSKGHIYTWQASTAGLLHLTEALLFFFLLGVGAPLIAWIIQQTYPNSFLRYVNPLIFNGPGLVPPTTALGYVPAAGVGFFFQYWIRRQVLPYSLSLWTKYNYVLAIGLDSGVAFTFLIIFFALQFPKNGVIGAKNILVWWGNTVTHTLYYGPQGAGTPVQTLAPGEKLGYTSRRHRVEATDRLANAARKVNTILYRDSLIIPRDNNGVKPA